MRIIAILFALYFAIAAIGCATVKITSHEYCLTYHPIVATKAEFLALPDDIARQLLGNENTYAQLCK